jgi:hypothetical protein
MNRSIQSASQSLVILSKRNSFIGFLSAISLYLTMFAGFSFVGSSLIGMFFAYLVIIFSIEKIRLDALQVLSIVVVFSYITFVLFLANDQAIVLQNIRYWFGVLLYIFFLIARPDARLVSFAFVRFLSATILIESLLINTVVSSTLLHSESNEIGVLFMDWYERPLSFAGNPGTSGIALLVLFFMVEKLLKIKAKKLDLLLLYAAVLALVSGTAIAGLILLIVFRALNMRKMRYVLLSAFIPLFLIVYILFNTDVEQIQKFSIVYFIEIFDFKILQIVSLVQMDMLSRLFGSQLIDSVATTSGDFGWLLFFSSMGWIGVVAYLFLIISFYRGGKSLLPVLLLMLIGSVHYPSAMSPAGQLIMAMVLTFGPLFKKQEQYRNGAKILHI